MDTQTVPFQPGVLLRGGQLSVGVSKIIFFPFSLLIQFQVFPPKGLHKYSKLNSIVLKVNIQIKKYFFKEFWIWSNS